MLILLALGLFWAVGLATWVPLLWGAKRLVAGVSLLGISVSSGLLFGSRPSVWTALVVFFCIYQCINLLRLVEGRTRADYLYKVSLGSSLWLSASLAIVGLLAGINYSLELSHEAWWLAIGTCQLVLAVLLFLSLKRNLKATRMSTKIATLSDNELPTLSVCIPARNETDDLEACLKSLTYSDYPKLEILVLDDCSQNKRTPEIIREFAQKGVTFINGKTPPENWLAKNYAYYQLAEAANGEILLFCGVDTRFGVNTLAEMVETTLQKKKRMVSFAPINKPNKLTLKSLLVQPGRYAWELTPPRRWLNRPPILSTCWMIFATDYKKAGTMKAIARSISPESFFAKFTALPDDGYSFMTASEKLNFISEKLVDEQIATAIRTRYPQVHRRPEIVAFLTLGEFTALVLPFISLVIAVLNQNWLLTTLFLVSALISSITYSRIVNLTYRSNFWQSKFVLPISAVYDIGLLNYSMWLYEFREVLWKGRNICLPTMRVIPKFPETKN